MSLVDWMVLAGTLLLIAAYGIYRTRSHRNLDSYLLGNQSLPWYRVGFSIMATQASAITFLSTPGQALQRWHALRTVLFRVAAGDDRDLHFLPSCLSPAKSVYGIRVS